MKTLPDTADWLTAERALEWEIDWILNRPYQRHLEFLLPRVDYYPVSNIVEYGGGSGLLAARLSERITDYTLIEKNDWLAAKAFERLFTGGQERRISVGKMDIRDEPTDDTPAFDLAMAWNFLKNFGLHEWDQILAKILAAGRYGAFNVQTYHQDMDDGTEYHHTFVTPAHLERAVQAAGHEIVEQVELSAWELHGEMGRDIAVWTRRSPSTADPSAVGLKDGKTV